jgi:hypothetical protein
MARRLIQECRATVHLQTQARRHRATARLPTHPRRGNGPSPPMRSGTWGTNRQTSAEGEHVGLDSGLEERDLERVLLDAALLTDELVQPRLGDDAVALLVDVGSV